MVYLANLLEIFFLLIKFLDDRSYRVNAVSKKSAAINHCAYSDDCFRVVCRDYISVSDSYHSGQAPIDREYIALIPFGVVIHSYFF